MPQIQVLASQTAAVTVGTYTAGKFLIVMYGSAA
jgi:hypothetical protein